MAYTFSDAKGHLSHGPSINGWRQVKDFANIQTTPHPALDQLIAHGHTNMLPALSVECRYLASIAPTQDINDTLSHLSEIAMKADEIVALEY